MLKITQLQKNEFPLFLDAIRLENWHLEIIHLESLFKEFPHDFFIAKKGNDIVGFITALQHTSNFGFISNFIILKRFRSLGFGKRLFNFALNYLGDAQITLECKKNQESFYEAFNFTSYYDSINYVYSIKDEYSTTLESTSHFNEEKLFEYHKAHLPQKYIQHLSSIIKHDDTLFEAIYNDETKLSSYGICMPFADGYKVILSSSNYQEAINMFFNFMNSFDKATKIYLVVTKLEPMLIKMVENLEMKEYSRMSKMYNKVL